MTPPSNRPEPTFLFCIGATKAGTSWLYRYLCNHPDCYLRRIKELHYFDTFFGDSDTGQQKRDKALIASEARLARLQLRDQRKGSALPSRDLQEALQWHEFISSTQPNIQGYRAFLTDGLDQRKLVADITPAYALLSSEVLRKIHAVSDRSRFVYILREPVARLWSQARMTARRRSHSQREFEALAEKCMCTLVDAIETGAKGREDYRGAVGRLRQAVPPQDYLVMLFDELMTSAGLARLTSFLSIRDHPGDFSAKAHEGLPAVLPDGLKQRSRRALRDQYDFVEEFFGSIPPGWLIDANY